MKMFLFPLLLVFGLVSSAQAETKTILHGELVSQDRCEKPVKVQVYSDGRSEYVSIANDLFSRIFAGDLAVAASPCYLTYQFRGKDKSGAEISLKTQLSRVPPKGQVCLAAEPLYNTSATIISRSGKAAYQGNLKEARGK